jgi:hypothetical protein
LLLGEEPHTASMDLTSAPVNVHERRPRAMSQDGWRLDEICSSRGDIIECMEHCTTARACGVGSTESVVQLFQPEDHEIVAVSIAGEYCRVL